MRDFDLVEEDAAALKNIYMRFIDLMHELDAKFNAHYGNDNCVYAEESFRELIIPQWNKLLDEGYLGNLPESPWWTKYRIQEEMKRAAESKVDL